MLYRVGLITVYAQPENPRVNLAVYKVSDAVRIGRVQEFSGTVPLLPLDVTNPRLWLLAAVKRSINP